MCIDFDGYHSGGSYFVLRLVSHNCTSVVLLQHFLLLLPFFFSDFFSTNPNFFFSKELQTLVHNLLHFLFIKRRTSVHKTKEGEGEGEGMLTN